MMRRGVHLPDEIRAELEQTPSWWLRQFHTLVAQTFDRAPFDAAAHEGHQLIDVTTYADREPQFECADCPAAPVIPKVTN